MKGFRTLSLVLLSTVLGISAAVAQEKLILGGVVDLSVGSRDLASTQTSQNTGAEYGGTGALNIPIWNGIAVQLDGVAEYYGSVDSGDQPTRNYAWGGHLSYRVPNHGLIGVFFAQSKSILKDRPGDHYAMNLWGIEAQHYYKNWTFYGQYGRGDMTRSDGEREGFIDGWFARGVVRHFLSPNTKLEAEYSWGRANPYIDGGDAGEFSAWGASIDHKLFNLGSHPVYGTLSYRGAYYDATTEDDTATEHVFKVGVKILFGAKDLLHNDRYGATLDLPMMAIRANGLAEEID